jgi:hypothetical protein
MRSRCWLESGTIKEGKDSMEITYKLGCMRLSDLTAKDIGRWFIFDNDLRNEEPVSIFRITDIRKVNGRVHIVSMFELTAGKHLSFMQSNDNLDNIVIHFLNM